MNKVFKIALGLLAVISMGSAANATVVYNDNFTGASTGGIGGGGYYFDDHQGTETYLATGLTSVDQLTLTLNTNFYGISETLGFTFYLNGSEIGSTDFLVGGAASQILDFSFAALESLTGDWTLLMDVTDPVCNGCGALRFASNAPLSLISNSRDVPEPAPLALLGLGLLGLGLARKKRA